MSGIPGAGKSTLARQICRLTNTVLLDLDIVKSAVLASFQNDIDFKFAGKVAYDAIFSLAGSNLELGNSVVIDSPCRYEVILEKGIYLAKTYGASYKFIECGLENLQELNRRRTMRKILPSQIYNTPINEDELRDSIMSLKRPTDYEYLLVDTDHEIETYIDNVMKYLRKEVRRG